VAIKWPTFLANNEPGMYINPRQVDDALVRRWVAARWRHRRWWVDPNSTGEWHRLRIRNDADKTSMRTIAAVHESCVGEDLKSTKKQIEVLCLMKWG
jgi:hypothetical protein